MSILKFGLSLGILVNNMSMLSRDDVVRLARLARISLSDDEVEAFAVELSAILGYVEQLSSVDVADLKPTNQVTGLTNVMRPDEMIDYGYTPVKLLENVPQVESNQLKVKRMIG